MFGFVREVLYFERPGVEFTRALLTQAAMWLLALAADLPIYNRVWFWVALPPALMLLSGMLGAAKRGWAVGVREDGPDLRIQIENVAFVEAQVGQGLDEPAGTLFIMSLAIWNAGTMPSIADWRVFAESANTPPLAGIVFDEHVIAGAGLELTDDTGRTRIIEPETLINRLTGTPVQSGQRVMGFLTGALPGIRKRELFQPGAKIGVQWRDVKENVREELMTYETWRVLLQAFQLKATKKRGAPAS